MNLENILLIKSSQTQKVTYCMTPFITISRTGISIATDQTDGFQRLGEG